ncbi:DNA ligase 4 [Cladophialophora carrionii]|uniref:DNA ligase n=1 Tax=Cladophialophora carrionii TaxID=86049 RepID=A0A1C1C9G4_9EURO|nr:DNA ligase 4 [Cladophialophora carrionii]
MSEDDSQYGFSQRSNAPRSREDIERQLDEEYPNRPRNHGKSRPFHSLFQELFNPLLDLRNKPKVAVVNRRKVGPDGQSNKSPSERRRDLIERYISRWRREVGPDFFPALRLIIPDKDRERGVYGLKEKIIAKLLIKIMKIDKNSEDGYNLLNWKNPGQTNTSHTAGNFAARCHDALSKRPMRTKVGDMTIDEVNEMLDELSAAPKEEDQLPILAEFYKRMNAEELKWLIQIILKEMKVGATERTFFALWHPDAESLFNVSSNLRRVCWELYDPNVRLDGDEAGVALMQCFQPMLALSKQEPLKKVVEALRPTPEDPKFWIEEKLDGERMQMHMVTDDSHPGGKRFQFWSRKAKDYTYLYGNGFQDPNGALTQSIKNCFRDGVDNIILDGEMITWDPNEKAPVPFGTLKTAALAEQRNPFAQGHRPVFRIFDILLLNGQPLTRYELRDRRKALAASINSAPERFEIHDYVVATKVEEVEDLLRQVVAEASEGLVLKNPRSMYLLDDRSGDWQKVKPEYMEGFGEDLDCVILGGYYGSGKRGGFLSSFLCGLRASRQDLEVASQQQSQSQSQSQSQHQRRKGSTHNLGGKAPPSQRQRHSQAENQSQSQSQSQALVPDSQPAQFEEDGPVENFTTFFKVGGGMTANDYAAIRHATDGKWHRWDSRRPAAADYIDQGDLSKLAEKPDMWIKPSDSVVVQVKAAQVTASTDYGFGYTLRFPRFVRIRRDRDWTTALSVNEFADLRAKAQDREEEKKLEVDQKRKDKRKARAGGYASRKRPLTVAGYNARDVNAAKLPEGPQGNVFEGLTFYIMTECSLPGDRKKSKLELEGLVKANGGRIVQQATPTSDDQDPVICVAARRTVKVASLEKHGQKEIIKPIWIFDCLDQANRDFALGFADQMVVPFEPERHLFFVPEEMKDRFEGNVDEYGDSYARDTSEDELREIMNKMGTVDIEEDEEKRIPDLFGDDFLNTKGFLFHGMVFYFDLDEDGPGKIAREARAAAAAQSMKSNATSMSGEDDEAFAESNSSSRLTTTSLKAIAKFAGAEVLSSEHGMLASVPPKLKSRITHIIAHRASEWSSLRKEVSRWNARKIPRIVTTEWMEVCWEDGTRVDEEAYVGY